MCSAISLGVFCRLAPSTSAIMRSRKVSPGLEVMRTTMRSDSTLVPPVTAERSPPLSRMTGADSPVMADSSTDATPSTTSPSPGMSSPASTTTRSPVRSGSRRPRSPRCLGAASAGGPWSRLRILRRLAAWALPRPSATASAKLANSTVNHSQSVTADGEPQRRRIGRGSDGVAQGDEGRQHAADLDHEHHRVADDLGGRELAQALLACLPENATGRTGQWL